MTLEAYRRSLPEKYIMDTLLEKLIFKQVPAEFILSLRHKILRPGLPIETAQFDGDRDIGTHHFACFHVDNMPGEPLCCVSYMSRDYKGKPGWQLRGMATQTEMAGKGIGKALVSHAEKLLSERTNIKTFWCNARSESTGFYEKIGWTIQSPEFDIPGVGPHYVMVKVLN